MRRTALVIAALALGAGPALAQPTGALLRQTDSTRRARGLLAAGALSSTPRADTVFAALVYDPALAAAARASAWSAAVVHARPTTEARVQANVCDMLPVACGARGAASVLFAGPVSTSSEFTRLADLNGLFGSARVQASYTSNATDAGGFVAAGGTFSQPHFAYRDSSTLARRSVERAAYALEAGGGRRWPSVSLYGGVRWEQAYHPRTARDVCAVATFGPAGTESCSSMVVGGPRGRERTVASVAGAWSIGAVGAGRLTISHDVQRGVTGFDLPVWVLPNPAGGLAGGLRFGYRTDTRETTLSLFVSQFKL
jgi:hypothetical protein